MLHELQGSRRDHYYSLSLAFTADSKTVLVPAYEQKAMLFWDTESGKESRRLDASPSEPRCLAISRDGQWLASTCLEQELKVWDLHTGEQMGCEAIGHQASIQGVQFSADGKTMVTASDDGTIRIWYAATSRQQTVLRHENWVRGMALSPDGKWIASNGMDDVRLWDAATGKEVYRLPGHGRTGGQRPVAFARDSRSFCTWGEDSFLRVWDVATGKAIRELAIRPSDAKPPTGDERPHNDPFDDEDEIGANLEATLSGDGRLLAIGWRQAIYCFDADTGEEIRKIAASVGMWPFAISADGKRLALAAAAGPPMKELLASGGAMLGPPKETELKVLDVSSGTVLWKQPLPQRSLGQLAFSSDGKYLLAGMRSPNNEIRMVESATGKTVYTISHVPPINWGRSLVLSPDGEKLACGMTDTSVLIWDIPQNKR